MRTRIARAVLLCVVMIVVSVLSPAMTAQAPFDAHLNLVFCCAAERSLRGIALGRKNPAMAGFFGSDNGGRTGAILTIFITTCKRLHINPFAN